MVALIFSQFVFLTSAHGCEISCDDSNYVRADLKAKREYFKEVKLSSEDSFLILAKACGSGRPLSNLFIFQCHYENCSEISRFHRVLVDPKSKDPIFVEYDSKLRLHIKTAGTEIFMHLPLEKR